MAGARCRKRGYRKAAAKPSSDREEAADIDANLLTNSPDWHFTHKRMTKPRAEKLAGYANRYLLPALEDFPCLRGSVSLSLRQFGFLFDFSPPRITVGEGGLDSWPEHKLRFTTAYILAHFELRDGGTILGFTEKRFEQCATVLTLARGYARDFIRCFQSACGVCGAYGARVTGDARGRKHTVGGFRCDDIFQIPCPCYDDRDIESLAARLYALAAQFDIYEDANVAGIFRRCL